MAWTEQALETLKTSWGKYSAREVASLIQKQHGIDVSRSAVCGKAFRLGLAMKRPAAPGAIRAERPRTLKHNVNNLTGLDRKLTGKDPGFTEAQPVADEQIPVEQRRTLMELTSRTCRWPIGTPGHPDFFFCGDPPTAGSPYCCTHTQRAWSKVTCRKSTTP